MFYDNLNNYNDAQTKFKPKYKHLLKSLKLLSKFILTVNQTNVILDSIKNADNIRRQEINNALVSSMIEKISQAILNYVDCSETLQSTYSLNMDEVLQYASDDLADLDEEDDDDEDNSDYNCVKK